MDPEPVLSELGLSDAESDVYLTMLQNGPGTASQVAKWAGMHRRHTYDVVNTLTEKGLASYVDKENQRVYKPVTPERLKELVADRRRDLNELDRKIDDVLPHLLTHFEAEQKQREVKVMEGKEGVKQLFNDELRTGEPIHVIGSPTESEDLLEYFLPSWTRKRQEENIPIKGVFEHDMRGVVGQHEPIEHRYLPEGYTSTVSMAVYGNTVGIIFWIDNPLVIMIEDEAAAASFMSYFQLLWEGAEE